MGWEELGRVLADSLSGRLWLGDDLICHGLLTRNPGVLGEIKSALLSLSPWNDAHARCDAPTCLRDLSFSSLLCSVCMTHCWRHPWLGWSNPWVRIWSRTWAKSRYPVSGCQAMLLTGMFTVSTSVALSLALKKRKKRFMHLWQVLVKAYSCSFFFSPTWDHRKAIISLLFDKLHPDRKASADPGPCGVRIAAVLCTSCCRYPKQSPYSFIFLAPASCSTLSSDASVQSVPCFP